MTDVALKEYLEGRLTDLDRRMTERFHLTERAVEMAAAELRDRLNGMNEFRDALKDQTSRMATRAELERLDANVQEINRRGISRDEHNKLDDAVRDLQRTFANRDGRMFVVTGLISAVVATLIAMGGRLLGR